MFKVVVGLILASLAASAPTDNKPDYSSVNSFALKLLDHSYTFQENFGRRNFAISPISVWKVFSLLTEGSSGDTFDELVNSLHLPKEIRDTQALHTAVNEILKKDSDDVTLNGYSAIFADKSLEFNTEFCTAAKGYNTEIFAADATNTTQLAHDINYVICQATEGKIAQAINSESLENLVMVLIDALYFKANWTHTFDTRDTQEMSFYNSQGKSIGKVNMMYHEARHNILDSFDIEAQILEMTYGNNKEFSMVFLLPFEGVPLKKMLNNLVTKSMDWFTQLKNSENITIPVECFIPRFRISSQIELTDPLKYCGVHSIFDSSKSQLPGISSTPLHVTKALQNVDVEVNEAGTVAAASTTVGLVTRFGSPVFEANRDFAFLILDRRCNIILFAGIYDDPSVI